MSVGLDVALSKLKDLGPCQLLVKQTGLTHPLTPGCQRSNQSHSVLKTQSAPTNFFEEIEMASSLFPAKKLSRSEKAIDIQLLTQPQSH